MAGMVAQSRVPDLTHDVLAIQPLRERLGVAAVVLETRVDGAQPAQRHEAVEGRTGEAQAVRPPGELLRHGRVAGDRRAADHVAVAVDVLGGGVHHQVGAERERLLPGRRQEGVVHHAQGAGRVRGRGHLCDVGDAQQRVARGLDPHQVRAAGERLLERARVAEVHELDLALAATPPGIQQAVGAAVAVVRGDDPGAVGHEVAGDRDRGHAARGDHGAGALLELGECLAEQVARRVARAGVIVGALLAEAAEGERGGQVQGRHHAAGLIVTLDAGAHRARDVGGRAVGGRLGCRDPGGLAHRELRFCRDRLTGLLRSAPRARENSLPGACRVHPVPVPPVRATLSAHLSMPEGTAGVGTFPGWLSLAVAPASKGLIPQPVSMSGVECRVWQAPRARVERCSALKMRNIPAWT